MCRISAVVWLWLIQRLHHQHPYRLTQKLIYSWWHLFNQKSRPDQSVPNRKCRGLSCCPPPPSASLLVLCSSWQATLSSQLVYYLSAGLGPTVAVLPLVLSVAPPWPPGAVTSLLLLLLLLLFRDSLQRATLAQKHNEFDSNLMQVLKFSHWFYIKSQNPKPGAHYLQQYEWNLNV